MSSAPVLLIAMALAQPADTPKVIPLWPPGPAPLAVGGSDADKPSMTFYPAPRPQGKASGQGVVICPGGGYGFLADDHEGKQVAKFFNSQGIHAFVLKYRIVTKDRPGPLGKAPLLDVQQAIRLIRINAVSYGLDAYPKVGVCGFSAGGHLASTAATHFDEGNLDSSSPLKHMSCRPDFLVLGYPVVSMEDGVTHAGSRRNLLGPKPTADEIREFSNERQVTAKCPPTFIFHTSEDTAVPPENALRLYAALHKAKVPVELHIYQKGRHGVGLGSDPKWTGGSTYTAGWPDLLAAWLKLHGYAGKK